MGKWCSGWIFLSSSFLSGVHNPLRLSLPLFLSFSSTLPPSSFFLSLAQCSQHTALPVPKPPACPAQGKTPHPTSIYRGAALGSVPSAYMRVLKLQCVCVFAAAANICLCTMSFAPSPFVQLIRMSSGERALCCSHCSLGSITVPMLMDRRIDSTAGF